MVRKERLELLHLTLSLGIAEPNSSASTNSDMFIFGRTQILGIKKPAISWLIYFSIVKSRMVRKERLELSHLTVLEPKSSASTNSATSANVAGIRGFEPLNAEIKTRCLTAWRYPSC